MRAGSWLWELQVKESEGVGLRDAGSGTPSPQVSCVNWERPPLWAASSPHWPLSQAGLSSVHNLPNLRWQTYRHPSGKGSEARGPHLPICLTSVTHRGSQGLTGAPALPQAGPEKQVPRPLEAFQDFYPTVGLPADMVAMLPKSGTPASSALPKPRPRQSPAPDKAPPCKSPAPNRAPPCQSPAPPPFRSPGRCRQEVALSSKSVLARPGVGWGVAGGAAAPRGSLGTGRGCRRQGTVPASPASRDPLSFYRCVLPGGQARTLRAPETQFGPSQVGARVAPPSRSPGPVCLHLCPLPC